MGLVIQIAAQLKKKLAFLRHLSLTRIVHCHWRLLKGEE